MDIAGDISIVGDGVRLRPMAEGDAGLLVAASRSDIPEWTLIPRNLDRTSARAWIHRSQEARRRGDAIRFVIETGGVPVGTVGASHPNPRDPGVVETFYFVLPEYRRHGVATAALLALDDWLRRAVPELRRLQLHVLLGNPGSERVAEHAGYRREGVAAHQIPPVNGFGPRDAVVFAMAVGGADPRPVSAA